MPPHNNALTVYLQYWVLTEVKSVKNKFLIVHWTFKNHSDRTRVVWQRIILYTYIYAVTFIIFLMHFYYNVYLTCFLNTDDSISVLFLNTEASISDFCVI